MTVAIKQTCPLSSTTFLDKFFSTGLAEKDQEIKQTYSKIIRVNLCKELYRLYRHWFEDGCNDMQKRACEGFLFDRVAASWINNHYHELKPLAKYKLLKTIINQERNMYAEDYFNNQRRQCYR